VVRGWQNHEYADTGAAMDALERGNSHLYEEMYPDVGAKTARTMNFTHFASSSTPNGQSQRCTAIHVVWRQNNYFDQGNVVRK
jgi:hypothetical protein